MKATLGGLEYLVGAVKSGLLLLLIGEGLGGADTGETGLDLGVDDAGFLLGRAALIWRRRYMTTTMKMGMMRLTTSARRHWMENMTIRAPTMVTAEMNRSSGPWWASSVTSNRSEVRRLISWPVRLRS